MAESGEELPRKPQNKEKMRYLDRGSFERLKEIPEDADHETIQRYARAFFYPPYEGAYIRRGQAKIEVLPELAKEELARLLHSGDLEGLKETARKRSGKKKND